jgi:cell wall-associated NlpC family hydrolase
MTVDPTIPAELAPAAERRHGQVQVPLADLRAEPRDDAELVNQALLATPLAVLEAESDPAGDVWLRVRLPDYEGWMRERDIVWTTAEAPPARQVRVAVLGTPLRLGDAPGPAGPATITAYMGTTLALAPDSPDLGAGAPLRIRLPSGREATANPADFVPANLPRQGAAEFVIAAAKAFLGTPYHWGGMTSRGIDCSGLMQIAFLVNGYRLPRDADEQFQQIGQAVAPHEWQPGDLIFYGQAPSRVTHVMLYMGDERVIHAKGSAQVVIQSMNPGHADYPARPDDSGGARRVMGAPALGG